MNFSMKSYIFWRKEKTFCFQDEKLNIFKIIFCFIRNLIFSQIKYSQNIFNKFHLKVQAKKKNCLTAPIVP